MLRVRLYMSDGSWMEMIIKGNKGMDTFLRLQPYVDYWDVIDEDGNPVE